MVVGCCGGDVGLGSRLDDDVAKHGKLWENMTGMTTEFIVLVFMTLIFCDDNVEGGARMAAEVGLMTVQCV